MRKQRRLLSLASLFAVASLVACTDSADEPVQPEPEPTPTATEEAEPEPTEAPVPGANLNLEEVSLDYTEIDSMDTEALYADLLGDSFAADDFEKAITVALEFATAGWTEAEFLSGEWLDHDSPMTWFAATFDDYSTPPLQSTIANLDPATPEDMRAIASLAPVLRPSNSYTVMQECSRGTWELCYDTDITFTELDVSIDQWDEERIIVSFLVSANRLLLVDVSEESPEGDPAAAGVRIRYRLHLAGDDDRGWLVEAFDNNFRYDGWNGDSQLDDAEADD